MNKFYNTELLEKEGEKMLKMINELYKSQGDYQVQPKVEPGFLRSQFSDIPPQEGTNFDEIFNDTKTKIFPGLKHWNHPNFFAYYPSGSSHATILADMFAQAFGAPGFVWHSSPSVTELENIVIDWMCQLLGLPENFLLKNKGGGCISSSVSDSIFFSCHAAKYKKIQQLKIQLNDPKILQFVGYYTEHSFPSCEKSLKVKDIYYKRVIPIKWNEVLQNYEGDTDILEKMIEEDIQNGLIPFWVHSTLGTTQTCAYDNIEKVNQICQKYDIWHNVDAAYSGISWLVEKCRKYQSSLKDVDSLLINGSKFFMVGIQGCLLYVKDKNLYQQSFSPNEKLVIYSNKYSEENDVIDYSNWGTNFGKRFNSLKFFYMIKHFGAKGLQEHVNTKMELAQYFIKLINQSKIFKLFTKPEITLTTFRLCPEKITETQELNKINQLLKSLLDQDTQKGYVSISDVQNIFFFRFVVSNPNTTKECIDEFFAYLVKTANTLLDQLSK